MTATAIPARLDSLKWILTAGFAGIFVLGFMFLWMSSRFAASQPAAPASATTVAQPAIRAARASAATAAGSAPSSVAQVDREVRGSLDELKDSIFRLELRHQAGTISTEDYARERARLEQTIRGLVQG